MYSGPDRKIKSKIDFTKKSAVLEAFYFLEKMLQMENGNFWIL